MLRPGGYRKATRQAIFFFFESFFLVIVIMKSGQGRKYSF